MSSKQKKIFFLAAIFIMQIVFLKVIKGGRDAPVFDFFWLSDATCTVQEYVYYAFEHLAWCYAFYFMIREILFFKRELKWFFWISVGDAADYLLTYNSTWIGPLSYNVVQILLIAYVVISIKNE